MSLVPRAQLSVQLNIRIIQKILVQILKGKQFTNWKVSSIIELFVFKNPIFSISSNCFKLQFGFQQVKQMNYVNNNIHLHPSLYQIQIQKQFLKNSQLFPLQSKQPYIIQNLIKMQKSQIVITATWSGTLIKDDYKLSTKIQDFLSFLNLYKNSQLMCSEVDRDQFQQLLNIPKSTMCKSSIQLPTIQRLMKKSIMWATIDCVKVLYVDGKDSNIQSFKLHYHKDNWVIYKQQALMIWKKCKNLGREPMIVKCVVKKQSFQRMRCDQIVKEDSGQQDDIGRNDYCDYLVQRFKITKLK